MQVLGLKKRQNFWTKFILFSTFQVIVDGQDQKPEPSDLHDPGQDEQSEFQRAKKTNVIPNAATNNSFWSVYPETMHSNINLQQQSEISNQRLKKLMKLFPQVDPGFLNIKVNEFEDEKQMHEWIGWAKRFFRRSGGGDDGSQFQSFQQDDEEFQNNNTKKEPIIGINHRPDPPQGVKLFDNPISFQIKRPEFQKSIKKSELVDLNLIDFENNPVNENCDYAEEAICLNFEENNEEKHNSAMMNIMDLPIPELVPNNLSNFGDNVEKIARKILLDKGPAAAEAIEAKNPLEYWDYVYR